MNIEKLIGKKFFDNSEGQSEGCIIEIIKVRDYTVWIEIVDNTNAKNEYINTSIGRRLFLSTSELEEYIDNDIFHPLKNKIKKL